MTAGHSSTQPPMSDPTALGPWDSDALTKLGEWDPEWAEACRKMSTNPWNSGVLSRKFIELVSMGLAAACTSLDPDGTRRHMRSALAAGATPDEILFVLKCATVLSIHSCSVAAPVVVEEAQSRSAGHASSGVTAVIPVTWDEQVQKAVDCFEAGARMLHVHVRDPKTGKISKNFDEYSAQIGRLREAVPDMVLQIGGSISFAPEGDAAAKWQSYDTRHMLTELDPKPDQVTVAVGSTQYDLTSMLTIDDVEGTHMADPKVMWQYSQMVADATPEFYIENLRRLREKGIQAYFALPHLHSLEIVERLIRQGLYMGPVNGFFSMVGGGSAGSNPFDLMELIRRVPQGSSFTFQSVFRLVYPISALCVALGQHVRAGIEENLWGPVKGQRFTTVEMIRKMARIAEELGRPLATPEETRQILKLGTWYNTAEETLFNLGLPPNRDEGERGFLTYEGFRTYETGGHVHAPAGVVTPADPRDIM